MLRTEVSGPRSQHDGADCPHSAHDTHLPISEIRPWIVRAYLLLYLPLSHTISSISCNPLPPVSFRKTSVRCASPPPASAFTSSTVPDAMMRPLRMMLSLWHISWATSSVCVLIR